MRAIDQELFTRSLNMRRASALSSGDSPFARGFGASRVGAGSESTGADGSGLRSTRRLSTMFFHNGLAPETNWSAIIWIFSTPAVSTDLSDSGTSDACLIAVIISSLVSGTFSRTSR